ncbi:hypothetical protein JW711_01775 [Candidatus Woesearchaeota archaeon]|nr:hypothetical protein [Candidatus Woesearchaeota archaeon]
MGTEEKQEGMSPEEQLEGPLQTVNSTLVGVMQTVIYTPTQELVHGSNASPVPRVLQNYYVGWGPVLGHKGRTEIRGPYYSTIDFVYWIPVKESLVMPAFADLWKDVDLEIPAAYLRSYSRVTSKHELISEFHLEKLFEEIYLGNALKAMTRLEDALGGNPKILDLHDLVLIGTD